jgi:hypothetical protein
MSLKLQCQSKFIRLIAKGFGPKYILSNVLLTHRLTIATKEYLAKKQKPQALYKLKQKKRVETVLEKRLHYLDAMDTILFKIENSQNDVQVT